MPSAEVVAMATISRRNMTISKMALELTLNSASGFFQSAVFRWTRMNEAGGRVDWPTARVTPQHAGDIGEIRA
jgi:hypothetical protein